MRFSIQTLIFSCLKFQLSVLSSSKVLFWGVAPTGSIVSFNFLCWTVQKFRFEESIVGGCSIYMEDLKYSQVNWSLKHFDNASFNFLYVNQVKSFQFWVGQFQEVAPSGGIWSD